MILRSYTIFDAKVGAYFPPFFAVTDGAAVRSFADLVADPNTQVGRHPRDFSMWCVGIFDDSTASIESFSPKVFVTEAYSLVPLPQPELFKEPS